MHIPYPKEKKYGTGFFSYCHSTIKLQILPCMGLIHYNASYDTPQGDANTDLLEDIAACNSTLSYRHS